MVTKVSNLPINREFSQSYTDLHSYLTDIRAFHLFLFRGSSSFFLMPYFSDLPLYFEISYFEFISQTVSFAPATSPKYPFSSVQFSHSVLSDSLQPHELQHTRPSCPSPTPGVYPNSCPSSWWYHPAISSSVIPFSSCPQPLPASGSFSVS